MRDQRSGVSRGDGPARRRVERFTDLSVWQRAMELADGVYDATGAFPMSERFGLASQLRRAAVSVPSNIAEGWGRGRTKEYVQFLRYARGSLYEVETQLRIAARRGYIDPDRLSHLLGTIDEVSRMLAGLLKALR